jgi:hypothetical protein
MIKAFESELYQWQDIRDHDRLEIQLSKFRQTVLVVRVQSESKVWRRWIRSFQQLVIFKAGAQGRSACQLLRTSFCFGKLIDAEVLG